MIDIVEADRHQVPIHAADKVRRILAAAIEQYLHVARIGLGEPVIHRYRRAVEAWDAGDLESGRQTQQIDELARA